jgi:hypothetical protein
MPSLVSILAAGALLLTGDSPESRQHGVRQGSDLVTVRSVSDEFGPRVEIVWERPVRVPVFTLPQRARVFTREKETGAPLVAGWRDNGRPVLWMAVDEGEKGYERFPYLLQALVALGCKPLTEARDLWAFLDSSYRSRADVSYLAKRWRRGGIAALHVAAWHYWEPDALRDAWLRSLIDACHREAIQVYAWIEFPHVSEEFWGRNPQWREMTAVGQDAHLDWRKLMNLADADCAAAVASGLDALADRFDWDGMNLGELYFESLEGYANPARFTPYHPDVLAKFRAETGVDPATMWKGDAAPMRKFLDFRSRLAARLQEEWIGRLVQIRERKPWLDLVLTHIDDRFDPTMRDKLGADAARLLPVAEKAGLTFLVEDPATIWHLGPERYEEIARRYEPLAANPESVAIDLNIVERYQDVYPTKQQTGVELFELVRRASNSFSRVALYFENSISSADWPLLPFAASTVRVVNETVERVDVEAPRGGWLRWPGCARVNGLAWPARDEEGVWLPSGRSRIERCSNDEAVRLSDFNGILLDVRDDEGRLRVRYRSRARAYAVVERGGIRTVKTLPPGEREELLED